jgi:hypothetical protein
MNIVDIELRKVKFIEDIKLGDTVTLLGFHPYLTHMELHPETYTIGLKHVITELMHDHYPCGSCSTFGHCFRIRDKAVTCGCILGDENGVPLKNRNPNPKKRR